MKFEELKNSLKVKIENNYYLFGVDEYLLSSAYKLIVKYAGITMPDLNLIKFTEGVIDCVDIVRALETMPIFDNNKVVYLDVRMSRKSDIKSINVLEEYLKKPNSNSILIVNIGDNDISFINKSLFTMVDCNRLDYKIVSLKIKAVFSSKGKTIADNATKLLFDFALGDLAKIMLDIDKLIAYVGNRQEITSDDIKNLVTQSLEYKIFELTEALSKKDSKKVFAIIEDMKGKKEEYKTLPALIYSHFRRLFMVAISKNSNNYEMAQMLGIKEYAVKMTQSQVGLFTKSSLKKINDLCAKLDFDLKQSNISIDNYINVLVLTILNLK